MTAQILQFPNLRTYLAKAKNDLMAARYRLDRAVEVCRLSYPAEVREFHEALENLQYAKSVLFMVEHEAAKG